MALQLNAALRWCSPLFFNSGQAVLEQTVPTAHAPSHALNLASEGKWDWEKNARHNFNKDSTCAKSATRHSCDFFMEGHAACPKRVSKHARCTHELTTSVGALLREATASQSCAQTSHIAVAPTPPR